MHDVPASGVDASDKATGPEVLPEPGRAAAANGFADNLASFGARPALITAGGDIITYAELATAADAAPLPPAPCLIALPMTATPQAIILYLAALRRHYPVILLDAPDSNVARRVRETYAPWLPGDPTPPAPAAVHPDLAVMLSTSGSTGSAKLVRLSAANIASNADSIARYLGLGPDDRAITSLPLHYSYGLSVLNSHLAVGAAIILSDASVNDDAFWAGFESHGATHLAGVPYSYDLFERRGLRDMALPSLRILTQAGGRLPATQVALYAEWAARRDLRFFVMYGQTEATARIAYLPPALAATHSDCIGVAIPGGTLSIEAEDGGPRGELVYSGPNVMMGYATAPADLAAPPGPPVLRTGDLAERTEAGLFRIVGRLNRFSKLFGLRISHDELETTLAADGVKALVTGDDDAVAVLVEGLLAADLAPRLARQTGLPVAAIRVAAIDALPRLASGKPDYAAAKRLATGAAPPAAPVDVAAVFAAAFPGVPIDRDASFSTLGGDSLSYIGFALALEDAIGELPPDWPEWTLARLEARAAGGREASSRIPSGWRSIPSDIVLRAAAICAIVLVHSGSGLKAVPAWTGVGGGALALMILFGFNMARFQQSKMLTPMRWQVVGDLLIRVILPYYVILVIYSAYKQKFSLPGFLLVSNYFGRFGNFIEPYWFLEVALQIAIFVVLLASFPPTRAIARRDPATFAGVLVAVALAAKALGAAVLDVEALAYRTLDANLIWVALGWAAAVWTRRWQQLLIIALGGGAAVLDWGLESSRLEWAVLTLAAIQFVPRLPMPRYVALAFIEVATASFAIYLTHLFVINFVEKGLGFVVPGLTLALAILVGAVFARVQAWSLDRRRRWTG